ncbi:NUDIX hydrolase [Undibacterium sp. TJN19]|uniref:NUDIX hydrolase n=1 Tax=Undibacterium sp. TJN19 TaxID=3413055 RepID=UPI003BF1E39A
MQDQLIVLLKAHQPADATEAAHLQKTLDFVTRTEKCCSRQTLAGHVTASAWILSPDRTRALLTHHKKLNRWLQLGGHMDADDASVQAAATREAQEESGMHDLHLVHSALFDVDAHNIPARQNEPEHYHYDLRFLLQAQRLDFSVSEESHDLAWVDLSTLTDEKNNISISRMAKKTLQTKHDAK